MANTVRNCAVRKSNLTHLLSWVQIHFNTVQNVQWCINGQGKRTYRQMENCLLQAKASYFNALQSFQSAATSQRTTGIRNVMCKRTQVTLLLCRSHWWERYWSTVLSNQRQKFLKSSWKIEEVWKRAAKIVRESSLLWQTERAWLSFIWNKPKQIVSEAIWFH